MDPLIRGQLGATALLLLMLLLHSTCGQEGGECLQSFTRGKEDFIVDADESVKNGAMFISSPHLTRYRDCVGACCKDQRCNVALMEKGSEEEGLVNSCFLFNCVYKKKYVCHFVRKSGYMNYVLNSVYESYLTEEPPSSKTKTPLSFVVNVIPVTFPDAYHSEGTPYW